MNVDETCHSVSELNLVDGFECSNCGIRIEGYEEVEFDDECPYEKNYSEYRLKYCPNCGRKIVEEDWLWTTLNR